MQKTTCPNCGFETQANFKFCSSCGHELPHQPVVESPIIEDNRKTKKPLSKKTIITIIASSITFIISYYTTQHFLFPSHDKFMLETAEKLNEMCPFMVDQETQLNNAVALPNNVFQYNYTLVNYQKDEIDIEYFKSDMEPRIINFVATSPDMSIFRSNKITVKYHYTDKNGVYLYTIEVTPDLY